MSDAIRTFTDAPAVRSRVPVLTGIIGPSGSGKTKSALRLAAGIREVVGGEIGFIDTETKRALHYAGKGPGLYEFRHLDFRAPYGSLDYLAAIRHFTGKNVRTVIIDSLSHEHEGEGGYLALHDEEMLRLGRGVMDPKQTFSAWREPAKRRRQLIDGILHEDFNLVACFRAKEKIKVRPGQQPLELGWMPIAGDDFLYEMTASLLLYPGCAGVPIWNPTLPGEKAMMKLPQQFLGMLDDGKQLSEDHGRKLAEWAQGGVLTPAGTTTTPEKEPRPVDELTAAGDAMAEQGLADLEKWFKENLTAKERVLLKDKLPGWKATAAKTT